MKLVTAEMMRSLDQTTIEQIGIPGIVLMENAGAGCAKIILADFFEDTHQGVAIVCGAGNNGGDGFVIARHLLNNGVDVFVYLLGSGEKLKGDARTNFEIAQKMEIPVFELSGEQDMDLLFDELPDFGLIVDAIFGTGLDREVTGWVAQAIEAINTMSCPVFAVDIPSGLNADTGRPMGSAVFADATATFGLSKVGQWLLPGSHYCGNLQIVDISIPPEVVDQLPIRYSLIGSDTVFPLFLPRNPDSHKGDFGHALIVAGSTGLTGAAALAGKAALRIGAGLVTVAVPTGLYAILEQKLTEVMTAPLGSERAEFLAADCLQPIVALSKGKGVVAIGPGIGRNEQTGDLLAALLPKLDQTVVLDADALFLIADRLELLDQVKGEVVLTPHPGEMGRLAGLSTEQVQLDRLGVASNFAREHGVWVVLKGGRTVVADPEGNVAINPTGNAGMASGGTGDVLTGMIAGLIVQGVHLTDAACAGVYLHGMAGDLAASQSGQHGLIAGDLIDLLPTVIGKIERLFSSETEPTEMDE